jgi:hypothetical protein
MSTHSQDSHPKAVTVGDSVTCLSLVSFFLEFSFGDISPRSQEAPQKHMEGTYSQ